METLTRAATKDDAETSYVCAMLLLCNKEEEKHRQRGVEFFEIVRASGAIERCGEVFREIFEQRWVEVKSSNPGLPVVCRSASCSTRDTIGVVEDVSRVSCVHYLADYKFLQMAGTSKKNRKKKNVSVEYECPLNLLPRDIWVRIATKIASNSIQDLFTMQVTYKVFLAAARSDPVYKHVTM
ncbi:hypothetical protein AHAS_Ahas14G0181700 [Arachis hypogaea]